MNVSVPGKFDLSWIDDDKLSTALKDGLFHPVTGDGLIFGWVRPADQYRARKFYVRKCIGGRAGAEGV
jgi:hypothetical protein